VSTPATSLLACFTAALHDALAKARAPQLAAPQLPGAAAAFAAWSLAQLRPGATILVVAPGPMELEALHADLLALTRIGCEGSGCGVQGAEDGVEGAGWRVEAERAAGANVQRSTSNVQLSTRNLQTPELSNRPTIQPSTLHRPPLTVHPPPSTDPLFFPALEGEGQSADPELAGVRIAALQALRARMAGDERTSLPSNLPPATVHPAPVILATCVLALQQPVPDPTAVERASVFLQVSAEYAFDDLVARLVQGGYARVAEVASKGELAVRGGLLDFWPLTAPLPLRAEFFGPVLDSLRAFDPGTQCSVEKRAAVWAPPCAAAAIPETRLADLLPEGTVVIWLDHDRLREFAEERQQASRAATGTTQPSDAAAGEPALLSWEELQARLAARRPALELFCGDPPPPNVPALPLELAPLPGLADMGDWHHPDVISAARQRLLADLARHADAGETVALCMDTAGACEQIGRELGADASVRVLHARLSGGFVLPAGRLVLAAQPDLYAVRKQSGRRYLPTVAAARGARVESLAELEPGDLVVHIDHGVGRYVGATEIEMDGRRTEVLTLEYAEGARLHVPVAHSHLLSRYVSVAGAQPPLHRLGGRRWSREKAEAERAIRDLAASLLETQARRELKAGTAFQTDPAWMHAFEAAFPYQETADQEKVIAEVKADMQSTRPMDRLVCGDAGYGKTEIAMRAAFIAVMNGRQVAVLVPTTVLAEQHYESFRERMAAYPIRIEVLSRFRTAAERARVLEALAAGAVDIVIGTHALLQPGVTFRELGLLVIDEEQRFGVVHKEYLKQVRQLVDVLTLTATPIPRTLYQSMTGTRDMSLLQTPPQERLAVETRIARDTDAVIRSAILQELNREGQVYFLYNRVLTIDLMRTRLERLVPEARVAVAHGQMSSGQLARIMRDFESGACDVLLCTTIVESGLDIPRANTIVIHRADRFGLADLYQLRGRVGRSSHKAYAYLLLPDQGHVDADGRQRLAAVQKHSALGAGFGLAMRDLEIRGAGNLLGAAQSGHIAAIGFGLYCQLLRRTVARLKGEKPPALVDVELRLDFIDLAPGAPDPERSACLPYGYVEDEPQRFQLHRRLAEATSIAEVRQLRAELADRYGAPPAPVTRLLRLAELRIHAAARNVAKVETREGRVWLFRPRSRDPLLVRGNLPQVTGRTADQQLASLFRLMEAAG
jgi:transcription-repair coupling factor (superfamily II helicase)